MQNFISTEQLYEHFKKAGGKVITDTRKIEKGAIFFALKGPNFNANQMAAKSVEDGCSLAVVDEPAFANGKSIVLVNDVLRSLQELALFHRRQLKIPILAITGSNGKTTNKELIRTVLSAGFKVLATAGNLNNHIGVPLTLLSITAEHEIAIIEMGANHQGEIAELCAIAEPQFGLITNIGKAHLEGFGGLEGVKKGKSELYVWLRNNQGRAFINGDDEVLNSLATDNDKITYGCRKLYDVIGKDCSNTETVSMKYTTRYGEKDWNRLPVVNTRIIGHYNFINCLAAAAVGIYFKIPAADINKALENYQPDMNRSQLVKTASNTIILDAYNANPNSMSAAIDNFSGYPSEKKLLLLGDMFELGTFSSEEHQKTIERLMELQFKNVILVGEEFYRSEGHGFKKFRTTAECADYLKNEGFNGYTVLIKGSRGMKMETLQTAL